METVDFTNLHHTPSHNLKLSFTVPELLLVLIIELTKRGDVDRVVLLNILPGGVLYPWELYGFSKDGVQLNVSTREEWAQRTAAEYGKHKPEPFHEPKIERAHQRQ